MIIKNNQDKKNISKCNFNISIIDNNEFIDYKLKTDRIIYLLKKENIMLKNNQKVIEVFI